MKLTMMQIEKTNLAIFHEQQAMLDTNSKALKVYHVNR
jgi:hypothetical protein